MKVYGLLSVYLEDTLVTLKSLIMGRPEYCQGNRDNKEDQYENLSIINMFISITQVAAQLVGEYVHNFYNYLATIWLICFMTLSSFVG